MCGIAGLCDFNTDFRNEYEIYENIVNCMGKRISHRGPDDFNTLIDEHVALAHVRLAVIDIEGGRQPMTKLNANGDIRLLDHSFCKRKCPLRIMDSFNRYSIVYNGEIYNTQELRQELINKGYEFDTKSDTEVILNGYIEYGTKIAEKLNGIFAFAIWDSKAQCMFLCRDRFGVKPLFYTEFDNKLIFSSEIKGILTYPGIEPVIDSVGMCDLFATGPARRPGNGVFKGIKELPPASGMIVMKEGKKVYRYYKIPVYEHCHDYDTTVKHTKELLFDSIKRQMVSDVGICTFLSGGVDSSIISAVVAGEMAKSGERLKTYSFDYVDNWKYFKASDFQPGEDRPFVDVMKEHIGSKHSYLMCDSKRLFEDLFFAVKAKDVPGMADVDSSLLYFAREIKKENTVCLSGECADEIFGGYPWFNDEQVFAERVFPWSKNIEYRESVLKKDIVNEINMREYSRRCYEETIEKTPCLQGENEIEKRRREIGYLNIVWFMRTLLERKDMMTMASGLEVRVPFADHRLIEYVYNVPWKYKCRNGVTKGLLRDCGREVLPQSVVDRKKSPYPKTYNPEYEALLRKTLNEIICDKSKPLNSIVDSAQVRKLLDSPAGYGKPWFGQLMALPQLYAYLIQINYWMEEYNVKIAL
ncbi:MAG: asparagine synthase (glutamine-hydrolyzing) [Lachnospiraceae bacterium]|nr:asparagine synthase (glutamine-hydrolyzing) [Lachnospiraceae bacterium]